MSGFPGSHHATYGRQQQNYQNRPAYPPPGWSQQQYSQQVDSQSRFQQYYDNNGHGSIQSPGSSLAQPPTQPQSFGVEGYNYQYSNCTGRRKLLLVGINYIGSRNQLNGCINDVNNVANYLVQYGGYRREDIVMLTDQGTSQRSLPLRQNIIDGMRWLVKGAQANDALFFHYSGHGGQTRDMDGDEYDGNDEVIYPLDFEQAGHIVDDEIHDLLVRPLLPGVRLTTLFDSCHSGSAMDLPYMYSTKGVLKEPNMLLEAGEGLLGAVTSYMVGDIGSVVKKAGGLFQLVSGGGVDQQAMKKSKQTRTSPADVISISGCKDDQTSADSKENGVSTGAMSYSFIKVMTTNNNQTYLSLLQNMRSVLSGKYTQKPQLSASHPIDTNLRFIF